jgi:hypothetical protein
VWALAAHRLPRLRSRWLWWATGAAEVAMFGQVGLGVAVMEGEGIEAPQLHTFYGFIALIAIAILYAYRAQLSHRLHLLYGLGGLFVMGLGIRAMVLG